MNFHEICCLGLRNYLGAQMGGSTKWCFSQAIDLYFKYFRLINLKFILYLMTIYLMIESIWNVLHQYFTLKNNMYSLDKHLDLDSSWKMFTPLTFNMLNSSVFFSSKKCNSISEIFISEWIYFFTWKILFELFNVKTALIIFC